MVVIEVLFSFDLMLGVWLRYYGKFFFFYVGFCLFFI